MQRLGREDFVEELSDYGIELIDRFKLKTIAERINVDFLSYSIRSYNYPWGEVYLFGRKP